MAEKIIQRRTDQMYIEDYTKYAMIDNMRRMIPDIRDGLKPVQRKVIYDMLDIGAAERFYKSARVVGDTMGKYYVHGDAGLYVAMQTMANWFSSKIPLIEPHGNYGTVMGDGAASYRYTEAKLSKFTLDTIISELKSSRNIVDWVDNFDRTLKEPEYLSCKVPLLLVNGTFGIGTGLQSNIPPHNLAEVCEVTRALIKDPKADVYLIPDHCQSIDIINTDWKKIFNTGYGKYIIRGHVEIKEEHGFPVVKVKSLPDKVNSESIKDKILNLIAAKQLPMVKDINDLSKNEEKQVDVEIILKKGADPYYIRDILYSKCGVQTSFTVNMYAVDDLDLHRFSYREYLLKFINYRGVTKFRLYCNKLKDASTRYHKLDAYIKVLMSKDLIKIIEMIRKHKSKDKNSTKELVEFLIKKCNITDLQAQYIIDIPLKYLSEDRYNDYVTEYKALSKQIAFYKSMVTDDGTNILKEIDRELAEVANAYSTKRLCKVIGEDAVNNIPKGTFKIVITEKNFIRKIPDTDKVGVVRGDNPKYIIRAENTESILLFDNKGKVFKLPVHKIPISDRSTSGTDARVLIKNLTSDIIAVVFEPMLKKIAENSRLHYLVVASRNNVVKRLELVDFLNINATGLMYSKIRPEDEMVSINIVANDLDLILYNKSKALRIKSIDIPILKRSAVGVRGIRGEELDGFCPLYPDAKYLIVVTDKGKINKFPLEYIPLNARAKAGVNVTKLDPGDGIFSITTANDNDMLKLVTSETTVEILVGDIKTKSPAATGQKFNIVKGIMLRADIIKR